MLLIILLFLVVVHKYVSLKENFFCEWDWKARRAIDERNKRREQYYSKLAEYAEKEKQINTSLQEVKNKQDEIEVKNDELEKTYINVEKKYAEILADNELLKQDLNKTTINSEICEPFNKLKLNAIKKIYS